VFVLPARPPIVRKPRAGKRKAPEQSFQRQVATYLLWVLQPTAWFTSIGHGGGGALRGAILKGLGLKAGVPDILIVHRGRCLFLELKAPKGVVSEEQKIVHKLIASAGGCVAVVRTLDEVKQLLEIWGVPTNEARLPPAERAVIARKAML
jgi:hypothetical protein